MEKLVEEIKNGNKESYGKLVDLMSEQLHKTAFAKLGNEELAEEAVQETFLQAFKKLNQLKEPKYFKTWVTKILINECNDINSARKLEKDAIDKLRDKMKEEKFNFDSAEKAELEKNTLLKNLNEKERDVVSLYYEKGYTTAEISKKLDINENTVKSFLCRARKKLRVASNSYAKLSRFLIFIFAFILITSGVTFGGRLINSLKEKLVMFQVTSNKAIEEAEDYIENINTDFVYNNEIGIKPNKVAIDDKLLYISYLIDTQNEIKDIELEKYIITDEVNNLLSVGIENEVANNFTSDYSSGGVVYSTKPIKLEDGKYEYGTTFQVVYNKDYPRAHKLYVEIDEISVLVDKDRKVVTGPWKFEIELPEKFYDRTSETYRFETNDKIKSMRTSLKDLSFELEIEFNDNIDYDVMTANNLILENSNGELINCYSKLIGKNRVKYICDIGKHSKNVEELRVYIKYNKGVDKYIDITLKK